MKDDEEKETRHGREVEEDEKKMTKKNLLSERSKRTRWTEKEDQIEGTKEKNEKI